MEEGIISRIIFFFRVFGSIGLPSNLRCFPNNFYKIVPTHLNILIRRVLVDPGDALCSFCTEYV